MTMETFLNRLQKSLMEDEVLEKPSFTGAFLRGEELPTFSDIGKYISGWGRKQARKAMGAIYPTDPETQDYLFVRDMVRHVLDGYDHGLTGKEVSLQELGGNLGYHIGNHFMVPRLSEIPKIFGKKAYKYITNIYDSESRSQSLAEATQNFISLHEIVEKHYQETKGIEDFTHPKYREEHDRFEAYLQRALKSMRYERSDAWDIYDACLAENSRGEGDSFRRATERDMALNFA
jgi:hypothetical protein